MLHGVCDSGSCMQLEGASAYSTPWLLQDGFGNMGATHPKSAHGL